MIESPEFESTELFEGLESESGESEAWERRGGRRFPPPRRATGGGLYTPRPTTTYVTQVQLQTALAKVGAQIKTNSDGIATINTRINTLSSDQSRSTAALKKETDDRKKELEAQKRDTNQKVQLLALLPLLVKPTFTIPAVITPGTATTPASFAPGAATTIQPDAGNTLNALLPLLLIGGLGSSGGLSSGSDGLDSGSLLILALVLSGGLRN